MENIDIRIHKHFWDALEKQSDNVQLSVLKAANLLQRDQNNPSIHKENINVNGKKGWGAFRAKEANGVRVIYLWLENNSLVLYDILDDHQYDTFQKNTSNKAFWDLKDGYSGSENTNELEIAYPEESSDEEEKAEPLLFSDLSESKLRQLGMDQRLTGFTKKLRNEADFDYYSEIYPGQLFAALELLREGNTFEDVLSQIEPHTPEKPETEPVQLDIFNLENNRYEEALKADPLDRWRIYLYPEQQKAVRMNFNGPAKITGGAGTGKTVVCMHRANWLAQKCISKPNRIFFTTFSRNLAEDISENLSLLCDPNIRPRILVQNLDAWAWEYYRTHVSDPRLLVFDEELEKRWKEAYENRNPEVLLPLDFYKDEWERVLIRSENFTESGYRRASRSGRGNSLRDYSKSQVWPVFEAFLRICERDRVIDSARMMIETRKMIEESGTAPLYTSIIADEVQDFGPSALRLLRTMAGEPHRNDLFLAGDAHQRIFQYATSLTAFGINVRGRSKKLRTNYRTPGLIYEAAYGILRDIPIDDLTDNKELFDGHRSLYRGKEGPVIRAFSSFDEEMDFIVQRINELNTAGNEGDRADLRDICLVARTDRKLKSYMDALKKRGFETHKLEKTKDDRAIPGIRIASMQRVKGLEFNHMIIAGMDKNSMPYHYLLRPELNLDPMQRAEIEISERCLLYVAMTRAKISTTITSPDTISGYLQITDNA